MKHARRIPLALFVACLVASTPCSWGAGTRAAVAGESRVKPPQRAVRLLENVDFLSFVAGMGRIPFPKLYIGGDLPPDVGPVDASAGRATLSSRTRIAKLLAPVDPIEAAPGDFGLSAK